MRGALLPCFDATQVVIGGVTTVNVTGIARATFEVEGDLPFHNISSLPVLIVVVSEQDQPRPFTFSVAIKSDGEYQTLRPEEKRVASKGTGVFGLNLPPFHATLGCTFLALLLDGREAWVAPIDVVRASTRPRT